MHSLDGAYGRQGYLVIINEWLVTYYPTQGLHHLRFRRHNVISANFMK